MKLLGLTFLSTQLVAIGIPYAKSIALLLHSIAKSVLFINIVLLLFVRSILRTLLSKMSAANIPI